MTARFGTLLLALTLVAPLAAQERIREEPRLTLRGVVVDALHGDPLPNTMLRLVEENRGMLADSLGRFAFADVPPGSYTLAVKQYGYDEVIVDLDLAAETPALQIELDPGPYALEGFTVVADRLAVMKQRLRTRRNATATSVQAMDQSRLARSASRDMLEFLQIETFLQPVACSSFYIGSQCVVRRGAAVQPRVYIDEAPVIGGLDQLGTYRPYELYLVEVYSRGSEIRAYTHQFMDRMARRPMALFPIGF